MAAALSRHHHAGLLGLSCHGFIDQSIHRTPCVIPRESLQERIWRAGVYVSVYNTPAAEAIWLHWPYDRVASEPGDLQGWIKENWAGLPLVSQSAVVVRSQLLFTPLPAQTRFAGWPPTTIKSISPAISLVK